MKIRHGFVTNSSSSSFIIAIKGGVENLDNLVDVQNESWKKFIVSGIKSAMEREDNCDTREAKCLFSNMKELNEYLEDEGEWLNSKDKAEYAKLVGDGFVIYRKSVGYHDQGTREQIRSMNCNFIKVIEND